MRSLALFFLLWIGQLTLLPAQSGNLISNYSFDQFDLSIDCSGWYNFCGKELTVHCDSTPTCLAGFHWGSASVIPEDVWSLHLIGCAFPAEGFAETYVTGIAGTYVYEARVWVQISEVTFSPRGGMRLGLGSQQNFVEHKSVWEQETTGFWKELLLTDTLTTTAGDTITLRLSAGDSDLCINEAYFDLVSLQIVDTLSTSTPAEPALQTLAVSLYPNPSDGLFQLHITSESSRPYFPKIFHLYDLTGRQVATQQLTSTSTAIDLRHLPPGLYIYTIGTRESNTFVQQGRGVLFVES